jgi:hypothetical protein
VNEQMKNPTDAELQSAVERFGPGDERSPYHHAKLQLEVRAQFRNDAREMPPDYWFDYSYHLRRRLSAKFGLAQNAEFERLLSSAPFPMSWGGGLEVLDPVLYNALVADALARGAPGGVIVSELRYSNPFFERLIGKGTSEKTVTTAAEVLKTVVTIGSTRKIAKAEATVAEGTVEHRIKDKKLDLELKHLEIELKKEKLIAERIANVSAFGEFDAKRRQRAIADAAIERGQPDIADAVRELDPSDAAALGELGLRHLELEEHYERDDPEDEVHFS